MSDWADAKVEDIFNEYYQYHDGQPKWLAATLAAALRDAEADGRQHENKKCQELIGARVGATQEAQDA